MIYQLQILDILLVNLKFLVKIPIILKLLPYDKL